MKIQIRVNGRMLDGKAIGIMPEELFDKGYGEQLKKKIILEPYEALYLLEKKMVTINDGNSVIGFDALFKMVSHQRQGFSKYLVYKDLRDRGYIVKEGVEPFYNFRLFEKGTFSDSPAKYRILILNEGDDIKVDRLKNYIVSSVVQERDSIVAVVDRRGEIIYYKSFLITSGSKIE